MKYGCLLRYWVVSKREGMGKLLDLAGLVGSSHKQTDARGCKGAVASRIG